MRRAAKVMQIAGIMIKTDPSYEEIYAKGLDQCADECETVMEPSELERLRRETFPNEETMDSRSQTYVPCNDNEEIIIGDPVLTDEQRKIPVFVFGSNEKGIHGGGAAKVARFKHGAILQQGFGPQGNSFAIPTCSLPTGEPNHEIPFATLVYYVNCFILYATIHPEKEFQVTQIGCGLAGWTKEQIAPLFAGAPDNCSFDTDWKFLLGDDRKFWGHVA